MVSESSNLGTDPGVTSDSLITSSTTTTTHTTTSSSSSTSKSSLHVVIKNTTNTNKTPFLSNHWYYPIKQQNRILESYKPPSKYDRVPVMSHTLIKVHYITFLFSKK